MIPVKKIDTDDYLSIHDWVDKEIHDFKQVNTIIYGRPDFANQIFETVKEPIILVTYGGDISLRKDSENCYRCDTDFKNYGYFKEIPSNIKKWYSSSLDLYEKPFEYLPLGILPQHFETLSETADRFEENRDNLLFINFGITSHLRHFIYININQFEFSKFAKIEWPIEGIKWPAYRDYLIKFFRNLLTSKFVLCPSGTGVDTYRMYEAMYLGCIPIVLKTPFAEHLKDFPVLAVDSYESLTRELLKKEYERIWSREYDWRILTRSYYLEKIKNNASKLLEGD